MDPELRAYLEENRRHFEVVAEGMGSQLQQVAEAVSSLTEHLDRVEQNLREEILRSQDEARRHYSTRTLTTAEATGA